MSYPTDAQGFLVGPGTRSSHSGVSAQRCSIVETGDRLTRSGATMVSLSRAGAALPVSVSISSPALRSRAAAGVFACHPATLSAGASNRASISWSCSPGTAMRSWAPWWTWAWTGLVPTDGWWSGRVKGAQVEARRVHEGSQRSAHRIVFADREAL